MTNEYVTAKEIQQRLLPFFSARHVAETITRRESFPAPRRIGAVRFWKVEEVKKWIESRKET